MAELANGPPEVDDGPEAGEATGAGGLMLVSTPIGNLGDLSPRALATLRGATTVLCEDTRVTGAMLARHGVSVTLVPLHEHNEDDQTPKVLARLRRGERVALVSDAGTPLVSDPGYRLVRAVIAEGLPVGGVPGPNAAVMALTLSGLPPHPFLFHGFLPTRAGPRAAEIGRLRAVERAGLSATLLFHEAPHRVAEALAALAEGLGADRPAAVARELTKRFEEVRRGTLADLAAHYAAHDARGEVVLVVGPAPEEATGEAELEARLRGALAGGMSVRDAAAAVAAATGLPRKQVYQRALELGRG